MVCHPSGRRTPRRSCAHGTGGPAAPTAACASGVVTGKLSSHRLGSWRARESTHSPGQRCVARRWRHKRSNRAGVADRRRCCPRCGARSCCPGTCSTGSTGGSVIGPGCGDSGHGYWGVVSGICEYGGIMSPLVGVGMVKNGEVSTSGSVHGSGMAAFLPQCR